MFIKEVYLENFRNYKNQKIEFNENVNVFYGNNAQGKTNILEALYFGAFGRSFRTNKEGELINFEDNASNICIDYEKNDRLNKLEIALNKKEKKTIKLNGIKIAKNSELVGNINIVIFSPDDILILKQGPSLRRRFLDILISQLKPKYLHELGEFNKILEQRNNLLKSKKLETLEIWNEQFAQKAEIIYKYRKEYIEKIQEKLEAIHPELTNDKERIKIRYITRFKTKEEFLEILNQNLNLDLLRGYTSEGPQREDFEILINEKSLNLYGSQGQHRTAILALKIAEMKIIEDEILDSPILLLDDITSELDEHRIQAIFNSVNKYQVFITCTDINLILKYDCLTKNIKLYNIDSGKIV